MKTIKKVICMLAILSVPVFTGHAARDVAGILQERTRISPDELPKAVKKVLESDAYKGWTVEEAYVIRHAHEKDMSDISHEEYYEVLLMRNTERLTVYFDKDGNRLSGVPVKPGKGKDFKE